MKSKWQPWPERLTVKTLMTVPKRHRADAFQEAWVAKIEGRSPDWAAKRYAAKEHQFDYRIADATKLKQNTPQDPAF